MNQTPDRLAVGRYEAARLLDLSLTELDNERRAGRLNARRHGRKVLFPVEELHRWLNALPSDQMHFAPQED